MAEQTFDLDAARKAGASDDQILSHLVATRKFDLDGAIKAGASKPQIIDFLVQHPPGEQHGGWKPLGYLNDTLSNIPGSGARMAQDIGTAVMHPVETGKAIGGLALGAVEKAIPGAQSHEKNVDALVDMYKGRYGSWDKFAETLKTDPVGVLADLSTFAGGVGAAGKGVELAADAAKMGRTADVAGTVARTAGTIAAAVDPLQIPKNVVQAAATGVKLPEYLYRTSLKGGYQITAPREEIRAAVKTGLEHSIPVTEGGVRKLYDLLLGLNQDVESQVKPAAARGLTVDPTKAHAPLADVERKFGMQVYPNEDLKDISKVGDAWLANNPSPIPADQAQAMKVGTYERLRDQYGKVGEAKIEAQKAIARGIKDELAAALPELASLNEKEGKLLNLSPVIEKAVNKYANASSGGFRTLITTGIAKGVTESNKLAVAAGLMQMVINDPGVRSRLAIALNYGQRSHPATRATATMGTALSRIQEYEDRLKSTQQGQ